jgi:hypothetical protein
MFQTKFMDNIEKHFVFNNSIDGALYEIIWECMAQPDRPHMTIVKGACALHAG